MKLRVSELLDSRGMTAYGLSKASEGRISLSAAYRLANDDWGHVPREVLAALCDVFELEDGDGLFQHKPKRAKK